MKILVTGYKGFLGSHLMPKLENTIGIDMRDGLNLLTCQLPDGIDLIYHLAAQSDVQASWNDPLHDLDNIKITARLAFRYPHSKIIYANSCAAIHRSSPYGFSKGAAGDFLALFHENTVNCVFPNIYGPGSRSVVDKFKGKDEVTVYGTGMQLRDYVHADDIIEGLLRAKEWEPGMYCMGSGQSTSVLELAEGKKITFAAPLEEDFEVTVPNTTPNWMPKISVREYMKL